MYREPFFPKTDIIFLYHSHEEERCPRDPEARIERRDPKWETEEEVDGS